MLKIIKRTLLPIIFSFVMIFSVACKNNKNNENNGNSKNAPYTLDNVESKAVLNSLGDKVNEFILKMNDKNVLEDDEKFPPNIVPSMLTILNDSYKASIVFKEIEDDSFEINNLYANKTTEKDEFLNIKTFNNEKLLVDLVSFSSMTIDNKDYEVFKNYLYELYIEDGDIKSLKIRSLFLKDNIPTLNEIVKIEMYEVNYDFEKETLEVFFAKPIQHFTMNNNEYLTTYLNETLVSNIQWGSLYSLKINLKESNLVSGEIYYDDFSENLKNEVLDFDFNEFYNNLTLLVTDEDYDNIDEFFNDIDDIMIVSYDHENNKFALVG